MAKRLTKEEFIKKSKKIHGNNYSFEKTDFNVGGRVKNIFICLKHNKEITHLKGRDFLRVNIPCFKCREDESYNKCISVHGNRFDYSKTDFSKSENNLNYFHCKKHGVFKNLIFNHLRYKNGGCKKCDSEHQSSRQKQPVERFIENSIAIHQNKYTYDNVHEFKNMHEKVWIKCDLHGLFAQTPANHTHKTNPQGCPQCRILTLSKKNSSDLETFIKSAKKVHGNKYDYSLSNYTLSKNPIEIFCVKHKKSFFQTPNEHLSGNGCQICGREKMSLSNKYLTTELVKIRCKEVWGNTYDYSHTIWENNNKKITVICPKHGLFNIDFHNHTSRQNGCRKCGYKNRKKQNEWLEYHNIPDDDLHREVVIKLNDGNRYYADGYLPKTKTVYEFWGDYWHGHPNKVSPDTKIGNKTAYELYIATMVKRKKYLEHGYNLIEIWEHEWDELKKSL